MFSYLNKKANCNIQLTSRLGQTSSDFTHGNNLFLVLTDSTYIAGRKGDFNLGKIALGPTCDKLRSVTYCSIG